MANIEWLGHASFRMTSRDKKVIYIDPWKLKKSEPKADLILISHSHYDHLSVPDVQKIQKQGTHILCSTDSAAQLKGNVQGLKPGETVKVDGITVRTTHAYNQNKKFHPAKENWLGFLVTVDGETIYYSGDSDPKIKPAKCIPYHYGDIVGTDADAEVFAKVCKCPTEKLPVTQ
jgi:L-ascorbate metabolism protein UlaG (beta-lactamase superfamily)